MKTKIPTNINEALISISELQSATNFLQGQLNLLLGYVTSNPENLKEFAQFAKTVVDTKAENTEETQFVAKAMIDGGLLKYLSPESKNEPSQKQSSSESNVIQFPKFPSDD